MLAASCGRKAPGGARAACELSRSRGLRRAARAAALTAGLLGLVAASAAPPARAHVVLGSRTLRGLVQDAAYVVRAEIVEVERGPSGAAGGTGRPAHRARVREVLKAPSPARAARMEGPAPAVGEVVGFVQHGHGVAPLAPGQEQLLFLQPLAAVPELRALADAAAGPAWVSLQEHEDAFVLRAAGEPELGVPTPAARAARAYVEAFAETDPEARRRALRRITRELLASPDPRLAASALRDVVLAGGALLAPEDVPALLAVVESPDAPVGVRIGLLAELSRRGEVQDAPARWVALLEGAQGRARVAVIRALRAHPSPEVTEALVAELRAGGAAGEAAAISLGVPGLDAAVPPLAEALTQGPRRLRMAAVRGLGRIGTAAARAALAEAAARHVDSATRRRAAAELEVGAFGSDVGLGGGSD